MSNNKTLKVFSSTAVAGMIAAAMMSSQAFAAVDAYSVKVGDEVFKYDKVQLEKAFLDSKAGEKSALYDDFTNKLGEAKGFYAFNDTKNGYVDYSSIEAKFLEAKGASEKFDLDGFTESKDAKIVEVNTVKKAVVNKDGKVEYVIEGSVNPDSDLDVASIESLSLKQVKVNFNRPVTDEDTKSDIEDEDNYSVYDKDDKEVNNIVDKVELDKSGKFAVLTFKDNFDTKNEYKAPKDTDDGIKNQETYSIEIDSNVTGKDITKKVKFNDFSVPEVEEVKVVGSDSVKLKFNKPVRPHEIKDGIELLDSDDVEVNEGNISVSKIELSNNNLEATVKLGYTLKDKQEIDVRVKGTIEGYNGYGVKVREEKVTVKKDEARPTVIGYKDVKKGKATLVFDKDIKFDGTDEKIKSVDDCVLDKHKDVKEWNDLSDKEQRTVKNSSGLKDYYHTNETNRAYAVKIDGRELTVYFNEDDYGLANESYVNIKADKIKTLWGEKNLKIVEKVKRSVDNNDLAIKSIEQDENNGKKIKVKFNKEVDKSTAEKTSNYELKDENGDKWNISSVEKESGNNKKVTIETSKKLDSGKYTLTIKDVEDVDGKAIEKTSKTFTATEKDARTSADIKDKVSLYNAGENDQKIVVDFDTKMKANKDEDSITNIEKYSLVALKDGKEVNVFDNNKSSILVSDLYNKSIRAIQSDHKVELTIPYKKNKDDSYNFKKGEDGLYHTNNGTFDTLQIRIGKVSDIDGNVNPIELSATVGDADVIGIKSEDNEPLVRAISTDKVQVTFDDELDFKSDDVFLVDSEGKEIKVGGWDTKSEDGKTVVTMTLEKEQGNEYKKYDDDDSDHVLSYNGKFEGKDIYVCTVKDPESKNSYDAYLKGELHEKVIDAIAPALVDNSIREEGYKYKEIDNNDEAVEYSRVKDSDEGKIVLTFEENIDPSTVTKNSFILDQNDDFETVRITGVAVKDNKVTISVNGLNGIDAKSGSEFGVGFDVIQNQPISDMSKEMNRGHGNQITNINTQVGNFPNLAGKEDVKPTPDPEKPDVKPEEGINWEVVKRVASPAPGQDIIVLKLKDVDATKYDVLINGAKAQYNDKNQTFGGIVDNTVKDDDKNVIKVVLKK